MPEETKRSHWLKYLFRGLLFLLVLIVVFYQQIFFGIVQLVAQEVAKSQAFSLQFKISGSIISTLNIEDLNLKPLPENKKLPLERVEAKRIALRYNLLRLLKKDLLHLIKIVELENVDVVVRSTSESSQPNPNGLRIPVVLPEKIKIQNGNLIVRNTDGDLEVNKIAVDFQQGSEGNLRCETLRLPAVGTWNHLQAGLSYNRSKLALTGLVLEPILDLHQLQIDLSGSEQGQYLLTLDAKALGSSVAANASYVQPAEQPSIDLTLDIIGLELGQIQKLWPIPISGSVPKIKIQLNGEVDRPSSYFGSISAAANGLRYQDYVLDTAAVVLVANHGKGELRELSVNSGPNKVRVTGNFLLPDTLDELPTRSSANIGIAAAVSEPDRYVSGLNATSLATGSIALANGRAQAVFRESVADISLPKTAPGFSISSVNSNVFAVVKFPFSQDVWSSLAAVLLTDCSNISYQDAGIQQIRLVAGAMDGKTATTSAEMTSGKSRAEMSANVPLPSPGGSFDAKQISGRVNFKLAAISDFIRQNQVEGSLTANGDLRFDHLKVDGTMRADGSQLKYRGMTLRSLVLDAASKDGEAKIQNLRVSFDSDNYVNLAGSAKITDPFPFQANGGVNFKDVSVLNEFLRNLGQEPGVSGGDKCQLRWIRRYSQPNWEASGFRRPTAVPRSRYSRS